MGADNTYGETSFNPEKLIIPSQVLKTDTAMKTALFCTSYVTHETVRRYQNWLAYYRTMLHKLKADHIVMMDDCSPCLDFIRPVGIFTTWYNHLGRQSIKDYPGWWRSFVGALDVANEFGFDKLIHIESDFYVLSDRMIEYLASLESGWTAMYSNHYEFPETAIQVICKDAFPELEKIRSQAIASNYSFPKLAEYILPFTHIEKQFIGDRLGEKDVFDKFIKTGHRKIDYIGQVPNGMDVEEFRQFFEW